MNAFFNYFLKTRQWINHILKAYSVVLFPQFHNKPYYTSWYNPFDNYYYNAIGLHYNSVLNVYRDLWANEYGFDHNQQTYWNHQGITFDKWGLNYSRDKRRATDLLGNHYHWCPITKRYLYSRFWSSDLLGIKPSAKPVTGQSVAAHVFLFKNHPFQLPVLKTRFTALVVSGFFLVNPIGDVNMIGPKPLESEQTQTVAQFGFRNLETLQLQKATRTQALAKPGLQKQTRVAASQITRSFDVDSKATMLSVDSSTDSKKYDTVNLLYDIRKCLNAHTKAFLDGKPKHDLEINSDLKTGIQKVYKQMDIAITLAQDKQKWLQQAGNSKSPKGLESVKRLQNAIVKRGFDENKNTIKQTQGQGAFNRMIAQQLREHGCFPLSGMKTLVAIKNDPEAVFTSKEETQISQEFFRTLDGQKIEALSSIRAHIIPRSWSAGSQIETQVKKKSIKLPFKRFPRQAINDSANIVTIPNFLEKVLDRVTKVETGLLPTMIKTQYNPAWRPEKNYLIANAISHDFYLPALSESEKRLVLQMRK